RQKLPHKHLGQKFQAREFLSKETYAPVSKRLAPHTLLGQLLQAETYV
ncbi:hypothetical protein HMPREF9104_01002, partial [Lentilactobacillus kisonensis F0435]